MYEITLGRDGKYYCAGRVQDGTECWTEDTLEAAVSAMISFAAVMNGATGRRALTRDGIRFLREVQVVRITTESEPWVPPSPDGDTSR